MPTYIIRAGSDGPVKIGRADDVAERITSLQTGHHETLVLLRVIDTAYDSERSFHREFAHRRIRGEWFLFDECMLTFVPSEQPSAEDAPLADVIKAARRAAVIEAQDLCEEIWVSFRGIDSRGRFVKRLARLIGLKSSQAKRLLYGARTEIHVHEMEGLRALARKLKTQRATEAKAREIGRPLPLFPELDEGR